MNLYLMRFYSTQPLTRRSLSHTGSATDQICLPINSNYLHSCYFRLHTGYNLTTEDKKFAQVSWEVLNILKENFPSKIFITQENLELCKPQYIPLQQSEELRRQISCLMSVKEEDRYLTVDEFEDAWHTLTFAEKVNDQRSLNICLDVINQQINNWQAVCNIVEIENLTRIINKNDYTQLTSNKIIAQEILDKVQQAITRVDQNNETLTRVLDDTLQIQDDTLSLTLDKAQLIETRDFKSNQQNDKPFSTRMCLFQLTESNDINRVTLILQTLSMKSKETLNQLSKKYDFGTKLMNVLKKYCNAEYGFEQTSSRSGTFQYNLIKLFSILSVDQKVFLEQMQQQSIEFLSQIIEEGVIYGYEDAISGVNNFINISSNKQDTTAKLTKQSAPSDLYKFLRMSLDYANLAISKSYQEFLPQIRENLRKVQNRIVKLTSKKDNSLLQYFIENLNDGKLTEIDLKTASQHHSKALNDQQNSYSEQQNLTVDQLSELKSLSYPLYEFTEELNGMIQKVEALIDLQEDHDEKYSRLFYKLQQKPQMVQRDQNLANFAQKQGNNQTENIRITQQTIPDRQKVQSRVQFDLNKDNLKYNFQSQQSKQDQFKSLPQYPSVSDQDFNSYSYDQKENIFSQNTEQQVHSLLKRDRKYDENQSIYPFQSKIERSDSPVYIQQYQNPSVISNNYQVKTQQENYRSYIPDRDYSVEIDHEQRIKKMPFSEKDQNSSFKYGDAGTSEIIQNQQQQFKRGTSQNFKQGNSSTDYQYSQENRMVNRQKTYNQYQ
eukprot:403361997